MRPAFFHRFPRTIRRLRDRLFVPLAVACGLVVSVPLWVGRFLPFLDVPQHLALATVLGRAGDPAWPAAACYEAQWGEFTPYWVHYLLWLGLRPLGGLETAARLQLTLYAVALPLAAGSLCAAWGRPRRLGLMAAPLALNTNLYLGFAAYVTAALLLLAGLALVVRQRDGPTASRSAAVLILSIVLFFTHVQVFALLLLLAVALAWRRTAAWLPIGGVALALLVPWVYLNTTDRPGTPRYFPDLDRPHAEYKGGVELLSGLPRAVAGAFQDRSDAWILLGWAAVAVAALAASRASRETRREVWVPPAVALACYVARPFSIQGQWDVNQRFAWLMALFLVATPRESPRWLPAAAFGLCVAVSANAAWHHRRFDREAGGFDAALAAIPPGARVMGLVYDTRGSVVETWPYLHFPQYAVVRRDACVSHSFAANAPLPVRLRVSPDVQGVWRADQFRYDAHGAAFDHFLVKDGPDAAALFGAAPVRQVYGDGTWRVFRR
jgi:hypothetical protein